MSPLSVQILRFPSLPSTNLEAMDHAAHGAPEGLCIVANEQTAGRGRLDRSWSSPKGAGIYFSILLRPSLEQRSWPLLTMMAALAVHQALLEACHLRTDIKWPNDILAGDRKLCGILAETVETPTGCAVVVGIGINLTSSAFPSELVATATSVTDETDATPDAELLLAKLIDALDRCYQSLQQPEGAAELIREWSAKSSFASGKRVTIHNGNEILEGITRGLLPDGALTVETDSGAIHVVRSGDVSLRAV